MIPGTGPPRVARQKQPGLVQLVWAVLVPHVEVRLQNLKFLQKYGDPSPTLPLLHLQFQRVLEVPRPPPLPRRPMYSLTEPDLIHLCPLTCLLLLLLHRQRRQRRWRWLAVAVV